MEHIWDAFLELSNTRSYANTALAITWQEIDAYSRQILPLSIWEKRLIRRVDDEVLAVINGRILKRAKGETETKLIPMSDSAGVKSFLTGLTAKKRKKGGM